MNTALRAKYCSLNEPRFILQSYRIQILINISININLKIYINIIVNNKLPGLTNDDLGFRIDFVQELGDLSGCIE